MEDILHHLGCIKPRANEVNDQSSGAGFQPSTVLPPLLLPFTMATPRPYPDFVDQGEQGGRP